MNRRTVTRPAGYQAWLNTRRAERELSCGRLGSALALAVHALELDPGHELAAAIVDTVRDGISNLLPAVDAQSWIAAVQAVEGWLTTSEMTLLARCVAAAPADLDARVVEIGSYKGRSTLLLALAIAGLGVPLRITAIDPHSDYHVGGGADTYPALAATLQEHGVEYVVDIVRARSVEVRLDDTIALAFIDGLHDAASVRADHDHIAPHVVRAGLVAFHDYRAIFPGVVRVVNNLLNGPDYNLVGWVDSIIVLRRL